MHGINTATRRFGINRPVSGPENQHGLGLVEMMISMVLSLLAVTTMVVLMANTLGNGATTIQMSRLSQVDRSILRLSAYQLKFCDDIPGKVVINEAIELAKKYSSKQSPGFVNGVLDAILRRLRDEDEPGGKVEDVDKE